MRMRGNKCSKDFPKDFRDHTDVNERVYPKDRHRENGRTVENVSQVGMNQLYWITGSLFHIISTLARNSIATSVSKPVCR